MAFTTIYSINLKRDTGLAAGKQWVADVFYLPSTAASGPTAPGITTGPLGSGGSATANRVHGDGTSAGYNEPGAALERAILFIMDDRSLNNP